jgi:hypothetical protein
VDDLPTGIDLDRHVLLKGRVRHPWYRRVMFGLVLVVPLLALLNVFGQNASTSSATAPAAKLSVQSPERLRGGLMYQVRIDVFAHADIKEPQLVLSPGWWEEITENSTNPQPVQSSTSNGRVTLSYGSLHPGQRLTVWLQYQVNPITVGKRDTNVQLTDGDTAIARVDRTMTILP